MKQILPLVYLSGYRANCYLVWSQGEAALVDPTASPEVVAAALAEHDLHLKYLLLTHAHYDHVISLYDADFFADVPVCVHAADLPALTDPRLLVSNVFGVRTTPPQRKLMALSDGDTLTLGDTVLTVHHTPGHTPGSVCYGLGDRWLTGDTLFADSIGATRFPGGDGEQIGDSLRRLLAAPPAHIYPGHGEDAPMEQVLRQNPYIKLITQGM